MGIPNLQDIKSIILFNGGSFGDLVKTASLIAIDYDHNTRITQAGAIQFNNFVKSFKWVSETSSSDLLKNLANNTHTFYPIENTHFHREKYNIFCSNILYIDYHNTDNKLIVQAYLEKKVTQSNDLLKSTKKQIQDRLYIDTNKISDELIKNFLEINWDKNLQRFRQLNLTPIPIYNLLLNFNTFQLEIKKVTNGILHNEEVIYKLWAEWMSMNVKLTTKLLDNFSTNDLQVFKKLKGSTTMKLGLDQTNTLEYHINYQGFRSKKNYIDVPDIAFFGCSVVFGVGVDEDSILSSYFDNRYNYGLAVKYSNEAIFNAIQNFTKSKNYTGDTKIVVIWCDKNDHHNIPAFINQLPKTVVHFKVGYSDTYGIPTLPTSIDKDVSGTHPGKLTYKLWAEFIAKQVDLQASR